MGSLSIGFISLPAYSFLPTTLRAFTEDYQRVKLTLEEGTTDQIIHDVESGSLDVGMVLRTSDLPATLNSRLVSAEPLVVAMPASRTHWLAAVGLRLKNYRRNGSSASSGTRAQ